MNKKLLSVVISAVMILASISITALAEETIEINEKNFPDSIFREYIKTNFDRNKDGVLSSTEIGYANYIDISKAEPAEDGKDDGTKNELIESLVGIEHLTSLTTLYCQRTGIRELDLSKNTKLIYLNCSDTNIQVLDLKNNVKLESMSSYHSRLKELDLTANIKLGTQTYFEDQKSVVSFEVDSKTGKTICDFKKEFSDFTRVAVVENGWYSYDSTTGILTFKTQSTNTRIAYTYDTKYKNKESTGFMRADLKERADYKKVDVAIASIPKNMDKLCTETSVKAVVAAQNAVFTDRDIDQQALVDGYAKAIEGAIEKLEYKKADYSRVDQAISKIPSNMNEICIEDSIIAVKDAQNAVIRDKFANEQEIVDKYASAIEAAIGKLEYRKADYSKVDEAISKIPQDMSLYTVETINAVNAAKDAVIRDKFANYQELVDGYAKAIELAIQNLGFKKADYTKVNEAIAKIPGNMSTLYTEESINAVNAAKELVVADKHLSEQEIVDGYVKAIEAAIEKLQYKDADYSKVDEAIVKIPEDMSLYTEESIKAVNDAKGAIQRDKKINEQEIIDGYANALEAAISGLKKLEVKEDKPQDTDNKPVENDNKPVDNNKKPVKNDNEPVDNNKKPVDNNNKPTGNVKTSDNSNLMVYVLLSLISMAGVATVIGTRRRKENN